MKRAPFNLGVSRLGIDVGGVLSEEDTDTTEKLAGGGSLALKMFSRVPSEDCLQVIRSLVSMFGRDEVPQVVSRENDAKWQVFIISKCGEGMQRATLIWLHYADLFAR